MQEFTLRKATNNDSDFFYQVKKTVLKKYIEEIWGWNEDFQIQFHKENFHVDETQIVIVDENNAGTVEVKEDAERIFISSLYILPQYQHHSLLMLSLLLMCCSIQGSPPCNTHLKHFLSFPETIFRSCSFLKIFKHKIFCIVSFRQRKPQVFV